MPADLVEIVVGREATVQRSEQIQRSAVKEVLIIDAPPYAGTVVANAVEADLLARGSVGYRCLYGRSSLDVPGKLESIKSLVGAGEQARVASSLPLKMVMGDDSVAMLPLDAAPASITAAVVVHPSALLSSLRLMFDALWQTALPVGDAGPDRGLSVEDGAGDGVPPLERDIIQLLVAGLTDQAIGRQLGLAERTVQRKVRALMSTMDVSNRLQLCIRLAQKGWAPSLPDELRP